MWGEPASGLDGLYGLAVVTAADRPGHWYDNRSLLERAATVLRVATVHVRSPRLLAWRGPRGWVEARVSAAHEAGRVGLAIGAVPRLGFDLCDPARVASVRSALPLVLTTTERTLPGAQAMSALGVVRVWAAIEALAKCCGVGVVHRDQRVPLTSLGPLRADGARLWVGRLDGLVACAALAGPAHGMEEEDWWRCA